ncbi:lytic transglycosylase domain-containing protein [Herbaspirillum sp. RTI4]|uniref:lytic transglycosylase domain-containing protein n=1 Tax=Herbaspirillum sp. RTI4 TaxID=3048640 RepID=UPI002AB50C05|nr:lytic transglycosylase domain-containing protein [Herbaspirillum sp. RTI4]MDY7577172.1 lytic transglycosylase domain-containing protein [Herbaspirillum sp. RTI4]MEA9980462.1 lytic transglycosylase domain-containing protein [Herbaspirillum sp. RTI4]
MAVAIQTALLAGVWWPQTAQADCFDAAARYHQVNAEVLRAIARVESGGNPVAMHRNANGTTDYGLMQINSVHFAELERYGITQENVKQACSNVFIAAWRVRRMMNKYGNTWRAIGAYHSETPLLRDRYAQRIMDILAMRYASNESYESYAMRPQQSLMPPAAAPTLAIAGEHP